MTAASNSDARKRNAEKASGYQAWALERSCKPCQSDHLTACRGVAWDVDEGRVVACMCGCSAANHTDVSIPPLDHPDASTSHADGLGAHLEEGRERANEHMDQT